MNEGNDQARHFLSHFIFTLFMLLAHRGVQKMLRQIPKNLGRKRRIPVGIWMKENDDRGSSVGPVSFSNHMHKSNHVLIVRNVLQVIFSTVLLLHYADTISSHKKFFSNLLCCFSTSHKENQDGIWKFDK